MKTTVQAPRLRSLGGCRHCLSHGSATAVSFATTSHLYPKPLARPTSACIHAHAIHAPTQHQMKFAAAATAARNSLSKGAAFGKKLMSSAGAAVTPPPPPPPLPHSSLLSRGMMASAAMPRPKLVPPQEQHDHRPLREEEEDGGKENEVNGLFRRQVTTPRVPPEALVHDVEAAAAAVSAKTFPMWLGETRQSCVCPHDLGWQCCRVVSAA